MGPSLVTWESLAAWAGFMRLELAPWEALLMVRLGHKRAVIESERAERERKARATTTSPGG